MEIRVFDHSPQPQTRFPNVASEVVSGRGLLYDGFGEPNPRFYLGFDGNLRGMEATFANPYWTGSPDRKELLPASKNDITLELSAKAQQLGARAIVTLNSQSPRIAVVFPIAPTPPLNVGSCTVGFRGVWPLKGAYYCSDLQTQLGPIKKALEPYGAIVLRETSTRILEGLVQDALNNGKWRIDAMDRPSTEFLKDNLITDLAGLLFDDVTKNAVTLKPNAMLPNDLSNTYATNQDGPFTRSVSLAL